MPEDAKPRLCRSAPEIPVGDLTDAIDHYSARLGFRTRMVMPDKRYAVVERDDVALHLFSDEPDSRPVSFHVFVSGIERLAEELAGRSATFVQPIETKPWGNRDFRVRDPYGNEIKFSEPA